MTKLVITVVIFKLLVVINLLCTQEVKMSDTFSNVAIPSQEALVERLKLLVHYEITGEYDKLYYLLSEDCTGGLDKKEFIKHSKYFEKKNPSKLISFTITEIFEINETGQDNEYAILGCARYNNKGTIKNIKAKTKALFKNDQWFFCQIDSSVKYIGGAEQPCENSK